MTTTIPVSEEVRDRLRSMGSKGESYDDVLKDLLEDEKARNSLLEMAGSWSDEEAEEVRQKIREIDEEDLNSQ